MQTAERLIKKSLFKGILYKRGEDMDGLNVLRASHNGFATGFIHDTVTNRHIRHKWLIIPPDNPQLARNCKISSVLLGRNVLCGLETRAIDSQPREKLSACACWRACVRMRLCGCINSSSLTF
jgi:hypothetical protein